MRIERLDLVRYGRFTDCTLDFSAPGLHLVVGPNEAGKSTLRSSVGELLYGIHPQTKLDFLHAMQDLRIAALLRGADGTALEVVRLKKTKESLRTGGDAVLPQGTLDGLLAGIDKEDFRTVFALDHEELQAGGRALLDGKGDLGEALFESRSSARLTRIQEQLRERYKAVYTLRGKSQALNALLGTGGRVAEAKREREAALLDPREYKQLTDAVAEARKQLQRLQESLIRERTELNRMLRIRQAYPAVEQRRQLLAERQVLLAQGAPAPGNAGAAYAEIAENRRVLEAAARAARGELARIDGKLAELDQRAGRLSVLADAAGGSDAEYADRLRSLLAQVEELRESRREAEIRLDAAKSAADRKSLDLSKRRAFLDKLATPGDPAPLRAGLKAVPEALTAQLDGTRKQLAGAEAKLAKERRRCARFALPEQLDEVAVPGEQEIEALLKRITAAGQQLAQAERLHGEECAREREGRRALERFLAQDPPPSEADLDKARAGRQELWLRVRSGLVGAGAQVVADDPRALAAEYESAVANVDDTADRMRREARRMAERNALEHAVQESAARSAELAAQTEGARAESAELEAEWEQLWQASGLPAPSPDSAADLVRAFMRIRELSDEVDRHGQELAADQQRADTHARRLRELLAEAGEALPESVTDLAELRALADARQTALAEAAREHATAVTQVAELRADAAEAARTRDEIAQFVGSLGRMWEEFLARHQLTGDQPEVKSRLESMLRLEEERAQLLENRQAQAVELEKSGEQLAETAAALARLLAESGVDSAEQLEAAIARGAALSRIDERLDDAVTALTGQGASIEQLEREVADQDRDQLDALISQSEQLVAEQDAAKNDKAVELARLEQDFGRLNGSAVAADKAEVVEQELAAVVAHGHEYLRLYLAERLLLANIEAYRQEHQGPVLRRAQEAFAALTDGRFVQLVDDTGPDGRAVLRARRAAGPAQGASGAPAGGSGAPAGGGSGGAAVAAGGQLVGVEAMSEGTRDQLYLALRLATLERYAEEGRTMPLLLDDVLMTFDDRRAAAALRVFDELAERFQVILLTHHTHLTAVAAQALPAQRLHVHRVDAAVG
ncbi:MAG TPA: AAA family ATPase [Actinospica sp.]|nr:AAA family ATPase [Actinospica sp.]